MIKIDVDSSGDGGVSFEWAPDIEHRWKLGIEFGVRYALERARGPWTVRVLEHRSNPVDTSSIVAAFCAAKAVWDACPELERTASLDEESLTFTFAKYPKGSPATPRQARG